MKEKYTDFTGYLSANFFYPFAELIEGRHIRKKRAELRNYYQLSFADRSIIARNKISYILDHCYHNVPYYRRLFKKIKFDPLSVKKDINFVNDIPYLTKKIIKEEGNNLIAENYKNKKFSLCKTGGSTGASAFIYYDEFAADYSSAVNLYSRETIGKKQTHSEVHFACSFNNEVNNKFFSKESFKCLAMNRKNIFFSGLDAVNLDVIYFQLKKFSPFLIHAHPSTIYALAMHIEKYYGPIKMFKIFESSGEVIFDYQIKKIKKIFNCKIINRYGLAELGVVAYQTKISTQDLSIYDSEVWPEQITDLMNPNLNEIVLTGLRNFMMPLIRYRTGDLGNIIKYENGFILQNILGRIHDEVIINGTKYLTHTIQDIIDHRIRGIDEFQIDIRRKLPILMLALSQNSDKNTVISKVLEYWPQGIEIKFVTNSEFIRVGQHGKFRHIIQ